MKGKMEFYGHLHDLMGQKAIPEIDLRNDATLFSILEQLTLDTQTKIALFEESHRVGSNIAILKKGRETKFPDDLDTRLSGGDEVAIFPLVVGC